MLGQILRELRYKFYKLKLKKQIQIGKNCIIPKSTIIRVGSSGRIIFGDNVELRDGIVLNCSQGGTIKICDNVFLNDYCCLNSHKNIYIGKGTQIGQGVKMYDHDHDYSMVDFKHNFKVESIHIGEDVWLGSNVLVLRGSIIGNNSVVGGGTVLKGIVEDNTLVYEKRETTTKRLLLRK